MTVLAACGALAQGPGASGSGAEEKPASVEGVVANTLTGAPVPRAHVFFLPFLARAGGPASNADGRQGGSGAMTNDEGRFTIPSIAAGMYRVTTDRVGFVMPFEHHVRGTNVKLLAGAKKDDVALKLEPVGGITGRVVDADGNPVELVTVKADSGSNPYGYSGVMGFTGGTTDEKGQFRIGGLSPGKYRVRAIPQNPMSPPEVRTDGTTEVHLIATYFPNSVDAMGAPRVEVRAGADTSGIEIRLAPGRAVKVSGTVSGMGADFKNVVVNAQQGSDGISRGVKPDGSFEMWNLNPGEYKVYASRYQPAQLFSSAVEVHVGQSDVEHLNLRGVPPADLSGQVIFEDEPAPTQPGKQPQPAAVPARRLVLRPMGLNRAFVQANVSDDGSLLLKNMHPDRYRVAFMGTPATFVKSMQLGSTQMDGDVLDLSYGAGGAALTIRASSATAEISGNVTDEKGAAASGMLVLAPEPPAFGVAPKYGYANADGKYTMTDVFPGKYRLVVADENDPGIDPLLAKADLEDYADVAAVVEVRAKDKVMLDLKRHAGK